MALLLPWALGVQTEPLFVREDGAEEGLIAGSDSWDPPSLWAQALDSLCLGWGQPGNIYSNVGLGPEAGVWSSCPCLWAQLPGPDTG